jgi:hypothetical protein
MPLHATDLAALLDAGKAELLSQLVREYATTMRVVRAVPETHAGFRPHERSTTALELVATLAREQAGTVSVLDGTWSMPPSFPAPPRTWADAVTDLEGGAARAIATLERTPATRLGEAVPFFSGPGQITRMPVRDVLRFWLHDMIHHRGQLSVYVRMAGGRVPAIYGPSADEPW